MWETHTDAGTGRPYYYNPDTGVTTWESPFEAAEGPASPATSPASVGSHESLETEWGQYWDEESRRVFFYNPLTGETAWEDEFEDQLEDEQEMQPGLGPSNQRVRGGASFEVGGTLSGWAGLIFRASDPASCPAQPWGLRGKGLGRGWVGLSLRAFDPAPPSSGELGWGRGLGRKGGAPEILALRISGSSAPCSPLPLRRTTLIC